MKHKAFTTQLQEQDYETMETLRTALGMKRSEFIKYLLTMFCLAYPSKARHERSEYPNKGESLKEVS